MTITKPSEIIPLRLLDAELAAEFDRQREAEAYPDMQRKVSFARQLVREALQARRAKAGAAP